MTWKRMADERPPADDTRWYWVYDGETVFPAFRYYGLWTNGDCWEDYQNEVTHYQLAKAPEPPSDA